MAVVPKSEFIRILPVLFQFRRSLIRATFAAFAGALLFGSGLGMLVPACTLLLTEQTSLSSLVKHWSPALPGFLGRSADFLSARLPDDPLPGFVLVMAGICLFQLVSSLARYQYDLISERILIRITLFWREKLYFHLLTLPMESLREVGSAQAINQLLSDMTSLTKGYRAVLGKTTFKLMRFLAAISVGLLLNWQFTLLALVTTPLMFLLISITGKTIRNSTEQALSKAGDMSGVVQESLLGIETLKAHASEDWHQRRFSEAAREVLDLEGRVRRGRAVASAFLEVGNVVALAVTGTVAAWFIFSRGVDPGGLVAVMVAMVAAFGDLGSISRLGQDLNEAEAAARRLRRVLTLTPERASGRALPGHRESIEFRDVSFRYPGASRDALHRVSFRLRFGELVGIAGPNGAGKSTLMRLLCRLLTPGQGTILIDGEDIALAEPTSLRRQIGLVEQEVKMFRATVAQNILLGRLTATPEQIRRAAQLARAEEFIATLPNQYESDLSELGSGLSTGQRQRLAIARALVREPSILLLDEPTSQIDLASERKIRELLSDLRGRCTILLIAHRVNLLDACDRVLTLEQGRLVESGPAGTASGNENESLSTAGP